MKTYSGHETRVKHDLEHRVVALNQGSYIRQVLVPVKPATATKGTGNITAESIVAPGRVLVNMALNNESWRLVKGTPGVTGLVEWSSESSRADIAFPASDPGAEAGPASKLTSREERVPALVTEGHPTREISALLGCSERTVKTMLGDIVVKLGARMRSQAVARAVRDGLI